MTSMTWSMNLTRVSLQNGQAKVKKGDYAGAEACFRKALTKLESHAFDHKIALVPSDVHLMLASACVKQNKFDDAESLLLPLSSSIDASAALQTYQNLLRPASFRSRRVNSSRI